MAITPYLIRTTLIFCLLGLAHSRAMRTDTSDVEGEKGCEATFAEGQTAALTFFIRHDELAREDFFASLRRSDNPTSEIVICDRKSPVKCDIYNPRYKSKGIANDSFTVLIPNITREFEDTYVFETYAKDEHQSTIECKLTVTGN
ncbi:uncharacterized protein [Littorina saxatilis]|uniref:uncharacterized protein isoform X2 n=1 Tax=Littorina saxatilis TaxID=31220 RepID=UPI0038B45952